MSQATTLEFIEKSKGWILVDDIVQKTKVNKCSVNTNLRILLHEGIIEKKRWKENHRKWCVKLKNGKKSNCRYASI